MLSSTALVAIIDASTTAIILQQDFPALDGVGDLVANQASAKASAGQWKNDVRGKIFKVNQAVIDYNSNFQELYSPLLEIADKIGVDPDALREIAEGLNDLLQVITEQAQNVNDAKDAMAGLLVDMTDETVKLEADAAKIKSKYTGDQGELQNLEDLAQADKFAMDYDIAMIAVGIVGDVVGTIILAVSVTLFIESGGAATPVIVTGLLVTADFITVTVHCGDDYKAKAAEYGTTLATIATLKAGIAMAQVLTGSVGSLVNNLTSAVNALSSVAEAWDLLALDYSSVITALQRAEEPKKAASVIKTHLKAAKDSWDLLEKDAQNFKDKILGVQVENLAKNLKKGQTTIPAPV
ncbi:unnamed protein product [Polarella glacialis]|uniref:Uncharacterized protein n=1 Tax=Polarella glacialis TaxID=89957 RepID=A0A813J7Z0_POLGL|nr:unnamed protein product [Polarella glacialis]